MNHPPFTASIQRGYRGLETKRGTELLASIIRERWRRYGYEVNVWVEEVVSIETGKPYKDQWCVRSDMINGMPRSVFAVR